MADEFLLPEAGTYVALDRGYFQEQGLDVQLTQLSSMADELGPLAAGQVDVGWAPSADPGLFNALNRPVQIRLSGCLSQVSQQGQGVNSSGLMVRQDLIDSGRYKSLADLKGMTISVYNSNPSIVMYLTEQWLAAGGLTLDDVTTEAIPAQEVIPALTNKRIDASFLVQPLIGVAQQQHLASLVEPAGNVMASGSCAQYLVLTEDFAGKHPDVAGRYVTAWLKGQREVWHAIVKQDGGTQDVFDAITRHTALKDPKQLQAMLQNNALQAVDPNGGRPLSRGVQDADVYQTWFLKKGVQQQRVDLSKFIDQSFLDQAIQQLGPLS